MGGEELLSANIQEARLGLGLGKGPQRGCRHRQDGVMTKAA